MDVGGVPNVYISRGRTVIRPDGKFPAPPRREKPDKGQGHATTVLPSFGFVYANDLARKAFETGTKFPAGSIIVRERFFEGDDEEKVSQGLSVMIKRAPGFNRAGGDWEFLLLNGAGSEILERQKKGSCLDCHASQRDKDFVHPLAEARP